MVNGMERYFTGSPHPSRPCRLIVSVNEPAAVPAAVEKGADLIELRLDQVHTDPVKTAAEVRRAMGSHPLVLTLRSREEGGSFAGTPGEWFATLREVIQYADIIDCERRFSEFSGEIRNAGREVIASHHSGNMPSPSELDAMAHDLRGFGDIAKIIVTPRTREDIAALINFTIRAERPVITGVMGSDFRYLRAFLPFFGSAAVFCHAGKSMAEGQYSIEEMKALFTILTGGHPTLPHTG